MRPYGAHDFWRTSPYYFFFRLGNVMAVLCAACVVERVVVGLRLAERAAWVGAAMRACGLVGQESLIVYVAHLAVLHGVLGSPGIALIVGHSLSLGETAIATVATAAVSLGLAGTWGARKARRAALAAA